MAALVAPPAYLDARRCVAEALGPDRRPLLIGVDGADGAGKSSFASWIAWQFGMPSLHLDLYLVRGSSPIAWYSDDLLRAIQSRLDMRRPLIVEGVMLLDALANVGCSPDVLIFVINRAFAGNMNLGGYFDRAKPQERANFTLVWTEP
jgi:hypothetical protein